MKFSDRVYKLVAQIPKGKVTTYREIAHVLSTKAYRAVGNALNRNPHAQVPCHRVINANGDIGGFASGVKKKKQLLKQESVIIIKNKINLEQYKHAFKKIKKKKEWA